MTDLFPTTITLKRGSHELPSDGSCAMEVAILAAGYGWTEVQSSSDLPACMSRVVGAYVIRLNDAMPDDERQKLMRYVTRMSGTAAAPEIEQARAEYLVMHAARPAAAAALTAADFHELAAAVAKANDIATLQAAATEAASAAWAAKSAAARAAADAADAADAAAEEAKAALSAWAADAAAVAAIRAAEAAAEAAEDFDWSPYLAALDGALAIGPQADPVAVEVVRERVRMLKDAR